MTSFTENCTAYQSLSQTHTWSLHINIVLRRSMNVIDFSNVVTCTPHSADSSGITTGVFCSPAIDIGNFLTVSGDRSGTTLSSVSARVK